MILYCKPLLNNQTLITVYSNNNNIKNKNHRKKISLNLNDLYTLVNKIMDLENISIHLLRKRNLSTSISIEFAFFNLDLIFIFIFLLK